MNGPAHDPVRGPAGGSATAVATRPAPARPVRPAPLSVTASITTFGTLAWLGWLWLLAAVGYGIALTVLAFVGERDTSLWQTVIVGWQNWPVLAAGISMVPTFGPMLITNGVTRARLASSAAITMIVLGVLGGLFVAGGFAVESLVFADQGWPRRLSGGMGFDGVAMPIQLGVAQGIGFAAWFVSGWLIGLAHHQLGPGLVVALVPALIPAAAAEILLLGGLP